MKNEYIQPSTEEYSIDGVVMQVISDLGEEIEGEPGGPVIGGAPRRDYKPGLD